MLNGCRNSGWATRRVKLTIFCVKQKTAYELRISDWSSDVCSPDRPARARDDAMAAPAPDRAQGRRRRRRRRPRRPTAAGSRGARRRRCSAPRLSRSEEHTSELQSLMRISYAVFCLQKNNEQAQNTDIDTTFMYQ